MKQTPTHKQFVRVVDNPYFQSLIQEARRVGYQVQGEPGDYYQVREEEMGEEVFTGYRHYSGGWLTLFSTQYWQEPSIP